MKIKLAFLKDVYYIALIIGTINKFESRKKVFYKKRDLINLTPNKKLDKLDKLDKYCIYIL